MQWRDMASICMRELGCRRPMFSVPLHPAIAALTLMRYAGLPVPVDPDVLQQFRDDVNLSIAAMRSELGVTPRRFDVDLRQLLAERVQ